MKSNKVTKLSNRGFVKLFRDFMDTPVFANPELCKVYIWCLLKANHSAKWISLKTGKGYEEILCKRGQFISGRNRGSEELYLAPSTYYNRLNKIKEYNLIDITSNKHYSIVTVLNYGSSNESDSKSEQPTNKPITPKRNPTNTNNNEKKEKNKKSFYLKKIKIIERKKLSPEIKEGYIEISKHILNLKKVIKMKEQLKIKEFDELFQKYEIFELKNILDRMDNHRILLEKYNSVFLTMKLWLINNKVPIKILKPKIDWDRVRNAGKKKRRKENI